MADTHALDGSVEKMKKEVLSDGRVRYSPDTNDISTALEGRKLIPKRLRAITPVLPPNAKEELDLPIRTWIYSALDMRDAVEINNVNVYDEYDPYSKTLLYEISLKPRIPVIDKATFVPIPRFLSVETQHRYTKKNTEIARFEIAPAKVIWESTMADHDLSATWSVGTDNSVQATVYCEKTKNAAGVVDGMEIVHVNLHIHIDHVRAIAGKRLKPTAYRADFRVGYT
jgi:hypothetical protein